MPIRAALTDAYGVWARKFPIHHSGELRIGKLPIPLPI